MATATLNTQKIKSSSLPPKRGQIKVQIIESFVDVVTSAASKTGEALGVIKRGGGEGEAGNGGSGSTNPPANAQPSHGYADHA